MLIIKVYLKKWIYTVRKNIQGKYKEFVIKKVLFIENKH